MPCAHLEEFKTKLRIIRYYTYGKVKGVIQNDVICSDDNVDEVFEKHRKRHTTIEIGKHMGLCDDCQLTGCWDKGKAVRCSIKKVQEK